MNLPKDITIKEQSFLARIAAWKLNAPGVALVLGKTIHLHNVTTSQFLADRQWVQHELKHIEQFRHYGYIPFLFNYFLEWIKNGYYNNRFEKEAREAETSLEYD